MPVAGKTDATIYEQKQLLELSAEEAEEVAAKKKALDALLSQEGLAKYKIEILFSKGYTNNQPSVGAVSFWESGSKFHGGGDTIMHICPGKELKINTCEAFIPDDSHDKGLLICGQCGKLWKGEQVYGQIFARLLPRDWAKLLFKYFVKLNMNADIRIKYHPEDIRSAAAKEQEKQHMGDLLGKVRERRYVRIYPLRNLIKDISAGADLEGRLLAFIKA